jgi:NAD(P)-dependent dehydrogenase (short-subunit alcohol dehydrogenase family)
MTAGDGHAEAMNRVQRKVGLVTGAAKGLGRAIAELLIEEGATVFLSDIDAELGRDTASELGGTFLSHDVTSEDAWQNVIAAIESAEARLDILVNNAAVANLPGPKDPERGLLESWRGIVSTNSDSVFLGCKWAIPLMRQSGGGSIVNVSSVAGLIPTPFLAAYGFSKAGVRQFTKSVALHCALMGIRCNSVHPGQVETDMLKGIMEDYGAGAGLRPSAVRPATEARIPQGRFQTPRDIALAVLFLASDESRCVTGTELVVDGGMTLTN